MYNKNDLIFRSSIYALPPYQSCNSRDFFIQYEFDKFDTFEKMKLPQFGMFINPNNKEIKIDYTIYKPDKIVTELDLKKELKKKLDDKDFYNEIISKTIETFEKTKTFEFTYISYITPSKTGIRIIYNTSNTIENENEYKIVYNVLSKGTLDNFDIHNIYEIDFAKSTGNTLWFIPTNRKYLFIQQKENLKIFNLQQYVKDEIKKNQTESIKSSQKQTQNKQNILKCKKGKASKNPFIRRPYYIKEPEFKKKLIDMLKIKYQGKQSGDDILCICPFHDEKTPSFRMALSESDQSKIFGTFNCFACNVSGNLDDLLSYLKLSITPEQWLWKYEKIRLFKDRVNQKYIIVENNKPFYEEKQGFIDQLYNNFRKITHIEKELNQIMKSTFEYVIQQKQIKEIVIQKNKGVIIKKGKHYIRNLFKSYKPKVIYTREEVEDLFNNTLYYKLVNGLMRENEVEYYHNFITHTLFSNVRIPKVIILFGTTGIGKSALCLPIRKILGFEQYNSITQTELENVYNEWVENVLLVEMAEVDFNNIVIMNKIKYYTGATIISINKKYANHYQTNSIANFLVTTNKEEFARIDENDRRLVLINCKADLMGNNDFFREYYTEAENESDLIYSYYKLRYEDTNDDELFQTLQKTLDTQYRRELIERSLTSVELWYRDEILDEIELHISENAKGEKYIITKEIYELYNQFCTENKLKPNTLIYFKNNLRKAIKKYSKLETFDTPKRINTDKGRVRVITIINNL